MTVSSSIGPISGIDYGKLIDGLMGIEQKPIDDLNTQIKTIGQQSDAFTSLAAQLTSLKIAATSFSTAAIFRSTTATSSNPAVLSATSSIGTATGAYSFTVQRLASSSQIVSQGFADSTSTLDALGVIPANSPLKRLYQPMKLTDIGGGTGMPKGSIAITNRNGDTTTIDLSSAATIQDVADTINNASAGVSVALTNDRLVLTDTSGGSGDLSVAEVGSGTTATALGLKKTVSGSSTLTGEDINRLSVITPLSSLNNGNGIRLAASGDDFTITTKSAAAFDVSLSGATTIGDVLSKINAATTLNGTQYVTAALSDDGHSIVLTDNSTGSGTLAVTGISNAARDLGLTVASSGNTITGARINNGLTSPLLRDLNNGAGIGTGSFTITNRNGVASTVTLDGSQATVQDLLDTINAQATGVTAALSPSQLGIALTDTTGGSGTFSVADSSGTVAASLGLVQSASADTLTGSNLKLRTLIAGSLTFQLGKGRLDDVLKLSDLNGGKGVARGSIRITDRSGASTTIDLSKALDLQDVTDAINNAPNLNMVASLQGDRLVLTDNSTGAGTLTVANVGSSTTATDLGLTNPFSNVGGVLQSADLNKLALTTTLKSLNDGNGVRTIGGTATDLRITYSGGTKDISLAGAKTLSDVLSAINAAGNISGTQAFTASLSDHGLVITDNAAGSPSVSVSALNGSYAARDLGLLNADGSSGTLTGSRLNAANASALISELKGGSGLRLGTIRITNRAGTATDIDLTGAQTVEDLIAKINAAPGLGATAALNSAGTGITLSDTTGLTTGTFSVADLSGHAAEDLGLDQTVSDSTISGADLHLRVLSDSTTLSSLNGGTGFKAGRLKITNAHGDSAVIDLSDPSLTTLGQILNKLNANGIGISASVNATGNGILLTDSSTPSGVTAKVEEMDGNSTAASLNILGNFTGNTLDGAFQKTINILSTDTLSSLATKVSQANVGVIASVISDGSDGTPYRLSFASRNSGYAGRLVFDGSALGLTGTTVSEGVDGAILYGTGGSGGLQATSSNNTYNTLAAGLSITATGLGAATVTVSRDDSKITDSIKTFTDSYNKVVSTIADLTKFDPNKPDQKGILFGDPTIQALQNALGGFVGGVFTGSSQFRSLYAAGISVNQDATLTFDPNKLQSNLSAFPDDLRALFTTKTTGVGDVLSKLIDQFTDAQTGTIFRTTDALKATTTQLNDRVSSLNDLLTAKKNRLIQQYANLEVTIAKLQSQGNAISSFAANTASAKK